MEYPSQSNNDDIEVSRISFLDCSLVDEYFKIYKNDGRNSIILALKNSDNLLINEEALHRHLAYIRIYYSANNVQADDPVNAIHYQSEFLNPLPPHKLFVKLGCIGMFLFFIYMQKKWTIQ